jgi:hypothetical protein
VAQGRNGSINNFEGNGELAAALDDFDDRIVMNPQTFDESRARPSLEEVSFGQCYVENCANLLPSHVGISVPEC